MDKPVCEVCECSGSYVTCSKNLPDPVRWKDFRRSGYLMIRITKMEDLITLKKGAFKGVVCADFHLEKNQNLKIIEPGTFEGTIISQLMTIRHNPNLAAVQKNTFEGGEVRGNVEVTYNGIKNIVSGAFTGLEFCKQLQIGYNQKLTKIEVGAFDGFEGYEM